MLHCVGQHKWVTYTPFGALLLLDVLTFSNEIHEFLHRYTDLGLCTECKVLLNIKFNFVWTRQEEMFACSEGKWIN